MMLAHFSHYLRSNQAPSECETRRLKAFRMNALEEISAIVVGLEQFDQGDLNSLRLKRANIQKSIDDCNTILAPIRRLYMDVLGLIFAHCLATHRNAIMNASEAPVLITHICSAWRSIALSIPQLWSTFLIRLLRADIQTRKVILPGRLSSCDQERRMEAHSEEVRRWLRLSSVYPLSISITSTSKRDCHQPPLDAIIQSSRRWQQLELRHLSPHSNVWKKIMDLSADDFCMLRELRLHSTNDRLGLWVQSALFAAHGLRSIHINKINKTNGFSAGIPQNWQDLNHLFIHSPILLRVANQMLNHCHSLVACLLEVAIEKSDSDFPLQSSPLPHLKFLSLKASSTGCNHIFHYIEAPSLQILDCQGYFLDESEGPGLYDFLQRINSLNTLAIDHRFLTMDIIFKCGTLIPSLKHLVLSRAHLLPVELMSTLYEIKYQYSPDSPPTTPFPSLEVFEAYHVEGATHRLILESIIAIIDATRSNTGVSKLRKVFVQFRRNRLTDIVPEALAYAQAAGIELKLELFGSYDMEKPFDWSWSPSFDTISGADNLSELWMYSDDT